MQKITISDVAKAAGVSKSTVSQFLNKRYEYMADETRKTIELAIEKLGYQPNHLARSLKQKRTSMIGIIVANIMHRFSTEISRAIEDYYHEFDIHAIVCNADDDPQKEKKYIEMLRAKQVDGLIIIPTGKNVDLYNRMVKEGYPVVFVDRKIEELEVNTVVANNIQGTLEATRHLLDKGHKRIAIITPPLTTSTRKERIEGYKRAIMEYGLSLKQEYIISSEIRLVDQALERLFTSEEPPTAIVAGNDLVFIEVLSFIKKHQIEIPDQLSVIVFDNLPFADFVKPYYTTVMQPAFEMGKKAAELLLRQIKKEALHPQIYEYPCQLMVRQSATSLI